MFRKRKRLENQPLEKLSQKGASVIILALIIMVFMSITILGITKLTISEKKRAKSTSVSAEAYQKADEAMECALWGRNEIIKACSNKDENNNLYFPQDITNEPAYCSKYEGNVEPHHLETDDSGINTMEEIPPCASPFYISLFTSKGKVESENYFTGKMTKQRGIGATVHTSDGDSESSLFKPYVCCNKIADKGDIDLTIKNKCNSVGNVLTDDHGPDDDRGWLDYWEPCGTICKFDSCAYYNTGLTDDLSDDEFLDENTKEGARWCWTNDSDAVGGLRYCMINHTTADTDDAKYWNHPDIEGFCSACNRVEKNGTDARTGNICGEMASNVGAENVDIEVWNTGGLPLPPEGCQGALRTNNCYSCNCSTFNTANQDFCNACSPIGGIYECAKGSSGDENDNDPDNFEFIDQTVTKLSTLIASNILLISGVSDGRTTSISDDGSPQYRICNDFDCSSIDQDWTSSNGTIDNDQYLQLRLMSSDTIDVTRTANIGVGSGTDNWAVTTATLLLTWSGSTHTENNCTTIGGSVYDTDVTGTICKYSGSAVPSGWTQAANWQQYSTTNYDGDDCNQLRSYGPILFKNSVAKKYTKGDYANWGYGCTSWWDQDYQYVNKYRRYEYDTVTNTTTYRTKVGIY